MPCVWPPEPAFSSLEIAQQPFDIVELELRAEVLAEAAPQLLKNAARTLNVDFARHLYRGIIAIVATAQRTAQRVSLLLRARASKPTGLAVGFGPYHPLLLH